MANKGESQKNSTGGVNINASGDVVIHGDVVGRDLVYQVNDPAKRRNQLAFLSKVKEYWIKGVYEKSIHSDILLILNKEFVPDQVEHQNPWDMILETPELGKQPIPSDKQLVDIFDELHQAMLILGAPGSGKTFTLLELAKDLIIRAEKKPVEPIPVILNLSSWAERHLSIEAWVIEELFFKYQIPRRISKEWVEQDFLCLLLDGLDEVTVTHRDACVDALNLFRSKHGLMPIALCSRLEEYEALRIRLRLNGALQILPLTPEQIDEYLSETEVEDLREDIKTDPELLKVIESPLMLNIASIAYQELPSEVRQTLPTLTTDKRRNILLHLYVSTMFKRNARANKQTYKPQEIIAKLSYLARQMLVRGQSTFLVEQLQPSFLQYKNWGMYVLVSRFLTGFVLWNAFSFLPIIIMYASFFRPGDNVFDPAAIGYFIITSSIVLIIGLWFSMLGWVNFKRQISFENPVKISPKIPTYWVILLVSLIVIGCPLTLVMIFIINVSIDSANLGTSIAVTFILFMPPILTMCLTYVYKDIGINPSSDIKLVETMRWSWQRATLGCVTSIILVVPLTIILLTIIGVTFTLDTGQVFTFSNLENLPWTTCLTTVSLPVGLFFGILNGIRGDFVSLRIGVNQGIHQSLSNSLRFLVAFACYGLVSILIVFGILLVNTDFVGYFSGEIVIPISLGVIEYGSLIGFLLFGGVTVINHYTLRVILALRGDLPWRIAPFLDYCVDRVLMRRIGGGYIFIHRYLMEYFASLDNKS